MIVILTAGTMLIFSVSFQFFRMLPEGANVVLVFEHDHS